MESSPQKKTRKCLNNIWKSLEKLKLVFNQTRTNPRRLNAVIAKAQITDFGKRITL